MLSYCLMPHEWHRVLWPRKEGDLTQFLLWLTHTPAMHWDARFGTSGADHLDQSWFKALPIQFVANRHRSVVHQITEV